MARPESEGSRLLLLLPLAAALEAIMLVRNVVSLPAPARTVIPLAQALFVIVLLVLWRWLTRQDSPMDHLQRVVPALLITVGLFLPIEQALTGNGLLAANLALVLVLAGALIVRRAAFAGCCAVLTAGWVMAVLTRSTWNVSVAEQATYVALGCLLGLAVFLLRAADRRRLEAARDDAIASAMRDHLTTLWNRRGLTAILPSMIGAARENATGIWCLFIDVRGLKTVNDTLGHAAGDRMLAAVGVALESTEVVGGVPARWGGDEFCVLGIGRAPEITAAHQHLVDLVEQSFPGPRLWDLSLGGAYQDDLGGDFLDQLVQRADEDMYRRRKGDLSMN